MKTETLAIARWPLGRERLRRMVDDGVEGIRAIVMVPFDDVVAARGWEVVSALVENAAIEPCAIPLELEYWPIGLQTEPDDTASIMFELRMRFEMA